jgi:hypothetical protein
MGSKGPIPDGRNGAAQYATLQACAAITSGACHALAAPRRAWPGESPDLGFYPVNAPSKQIISKQKLPAYSFGKRAGAA